MVNPKAKGAVESYSKNRAIYEALASRVESIIREILESKGINYHSISSRAKPIDSYEQKASKQKYKDPRSEIKDMAGIRIITYTDSDAKKISKIIKETFEVFPEHIIDKTEELGIDRVGYRSIHCVGTLGKERLKLPENKIFEDRYFEIQIRTILQHAWAEFEHDRNYKFRGVLPKDIRRRLSIVAGRLESIDREFDNISKAIDIYTTAISKRTELGDLSEPINSTSLKAYMNRKFKPLIDQGITLDLVDDDLIIEELLDMEITTLKELENVIPKDFIKIKSSYLSTTVYKDTFLGILRDILIIHNADTYFEKAWKHKWSTVDGAYIPFFEEFGIDMSKYINQYDLDVD